MPLIRTTLGCLALGLLAVPASAQFTRVTVATSGQPDGPLSDVFVSAAVLSGDGRFVAFTSTATNLVAGDTNASADVFVRDLGGATTTRVSVAEDGLERAGASGSIFAGLGGELDLSDDGRFVVFSSRAALVAGDTNTCLIPPATTAGNCPDIYLRDRQTNQTTRLSAGSGGAQANGYSQRPRISGDGRWVAFDSEASNLVAGDTNGVSDVFLLDRQTGTLTRVSLTGTGAQADLPSSLPSISDDGSVIAFASAAALTSEPDTVVCEQAPPACTRPFLLDRAAGTLRRIPMPPIDTREIPDIQPHRVDVASLHVAGDGGSVAVTAWAITPPVSFTSRSYAAGWVFDRGVERIIFNGRNGIGGWDGRVLTTEIAISGSSLSGHVEIVDLVTGSLEELTRAFADQLPFIGRPAAGGRLVTITTAEQLTPDDIGGGYDIYVYDRDGDGDGMSSAWETALGLDPAAGDAAADPDGDGLSSLQEFQRGSHPRGAVVRYHAEGTTNAFFQTRFALANPGAAAAAVVLRFLGDNGRAWSATLRIPPAEQRTLSGSGRLASSYATVVESDVPVVSDRTMGWGTGGYGTSAETSMAAPATSWFLAEGATHGFFHLFYLLQNPGAAPAGVDITYLRPAPAPPLTLHYTIAAESRLTIPINTIPGLASTDVSARIVSSVPILVERAMYMNVLTPPQIFGAGHAGAGVTATSTRWFLAEGATGTFFDLYYLLANPSAQATRVRVTYLLPQGTPVVKEYALPAESRLTISVENEDPLLAGTAISGIVESLDGVGIVVERSMWWPGDGQWQEGHLAAGSTSTARRWALADGFVDVSGSETYVLIANTSSTAGTATITTLPPLTGAPVVHASVPLPPNSRVSVPMSQYPGLTEVGFSTFGTLVESDGPEIVVERAMYRNVLGIFWGAGTASLGTPLP